MTKKHGIVTIDVYDADGVYHEGIGGPMTFEDVKHQMIEILQNDGIPVIRTRGRHEAPQEENDYEPIMIDNEEEEKQHPHLQDIIKHILQPRAIVRSDKVEPIFSPLLLDYKFDGITFTACGNPLDVHAANEALLKRVFEEDKPLRNEQE